MLQTPANRLSEARKQMGIAVDWIQDPDQQEALRYAEGIVEEVETSIREKEEKQ